MIEHEEELCIPKLAYITFEDEEGFQRANKMAATKFCFKKISKLSINGAPLDIKPAPESSNIMWQN